MPYKIQKIVGTKRYKVINEETRDVKSKYSTRNNAQKQVRLLNSLEKSPIKWVK
jgi:hypothetical protein